MFDTTSHAAFVERAYDEARTLLIQTRDYIAGPSAAESRALEPADRLRLTLELARLTRRLTEATAWLMLQKGVAAGEISRADAATAEAARIEPDSEPESDAAALARLPITVSAIFTRSSRSALSSADSSEPRPGSRLRSHRAVCSAKASFNPVTRSGMSGELNLRRSTSTISFSIRP